MYSCFLASFVSLELTTKGDWENVSLKNLTTVVDMACDDLIYSATVDVGNNFIFLNELEKSIPNCDHLFNEPLLLKYAHTLRPQYKLPNYTPSEPRPLKTG
jgi:hypothetical protein